MNDDRIFFAANAIIAPVWFLMIVLPRWSVTQKLVRTLVAPAIVAAAYLVIVLLNMGATDGGFFSLDDVQRLFTNRTVVLAGWLHYLCVDLVVGCFVFRDAQKAEIPHLALAPCLFLTLMWGPIGVLSYLAVRWLRTRKTVALD